MKLIQMIATLFLSLMLSGCKTETVTYDYLMQHPTELQNAYASCNEGNNPDEAACNTIKQAANDFYQLAEARGKDPEGFGREIINIQIALAKNPDVNSDEYKKQVQKLQSMYAVIAATSME
jgi:ABC-type uncharacterized transport system auxiliary subunit